jgi:hypothetical protein
MAKQRSKSSKRQKKDKALEDTSAQGREESEEALRAVIRSLERWSNDVASLANKNSAKISQELASATKVLGWPSDFEEALRLQLKQSAEMQAHMLDSLREAWVQQIATVLKAMPSIDRSRVELPKLYEGSAPPNANGSKSLSSDHAPPIPDPVRLWMETAQNWQKMWLSLLMASTNVKK